MPAGIPEARATKNCHVPASNWLLVIPLSLPSGTVPLAILVALSEVRFAPFPLTLPAVIAPAEKLPLPSRFTIVFAVFTLVAALAATAPLARAAAVWPPPRSIPPSLLASRSHSPPAARRNSWR